LWLDILLPSAAQHVWMAGAISLMTLAVMARATLGHTGNALTAGPGTVAMFLCIPVSVLARLAAGIWPDAADHLYHIAGASWILGFFGFVAIYGTLLLNKKLAR
ncbi:short-chain dehydrogenase, partial [Rhodobacterales bacterium 56_14_T64]